MVVSVLIRKVYLGLMNSLTEFVLYSIRWQLSTPTLYLITKKLPGIWGVVIANFVGSCIFYFVDKWIFK